MKRLWPLGPHSSSAGRIAATVAAYTEATGRPTSDPLTSGDREAIGRWLYDEDQRMPRDGNGRSFPATRGYSRRLLPLVHRDLSSKLAYLQQRPCDICDPIQLRPLSIAFAVNIRPFSAQALTSSRLSGVKDAIRRHLSKRGLYTAQWSRHDLCMSVVVLQSCKDRVKDLDNSIKGLLDAMQEAVYENDRQIRHLSASRVVHDGSEAYYLVSIRPVRDVRADVFNLSLPSGWLAGQEEIKF